MRDRGFEKISFNQFKKDFYNYKNIKHMYEKLSLPKRSTINSAGYDFYSPYDFTLKPNETLKLPTGIKAYMKEDEYLTVVVRSSLGFKYNVRLCNQVGIVDADYYNNEQNEGHIWLAFKNEGNDYWIVKQGDRIGQGIFQKLLLADNDEKPDNIRVGGMGSTERSE
jgi:dUTP pyrophosphatase